MMTTDILQILQWRSTEACDCIAENPNGILSFSPGLPSLRGYPGSREFFVPNPNGVASSDALPSAATPLGLENFLSPTQGSSCLATLGWRMQSRWDWERSSGRVSRPNLDETKVQD